MEDFFIRELLLTSSDSSTDDDIEPRGPIVPRPRIHEYIEEVVDHYSEQEFKENFRLNRSTFNQVLELIKDDIATEEMMIGHHTLSARAQLISELY
ncbi:hypothetical protein JTB14_017813 [Gonioctena quinquepunctata]|nr:hypothetical protein JTB14_017813 [Gonioctena quinquepunctata]